MTAATRTIDAGFIPLIDAALLVAAGKLGFAEAENLHLKLHRETSWANIRDKTAVGHFDVAHMLAPMPLAANLGLDPLSCRLIVPMALGLNGNTIVVSSALWRQLEAVGGLKPNDPASFAGALANVVKAQSVRPVFAVVHSVSAHRYELAYVMACAGLEFGRDIDLVVLPPQLMTDALESGQISGFCAGEPWGSLAQLRGSGRIVATKASIWRTSPEKVLGVRDQWAERDPEVLHALVRALYRAAQWCDEPGNRKELAALLAHPDHLGQPEALLMQALNGETSEPKGLNAFVFASQAATFPWISHALWFYSQMVRWRQTAYSLADEAIVRRTIRPDIYRAALAPLNAILPGASSKVEGALAAPTPVGAINGQLMLGPDGFFDGRIFDPDRIETYLLDLSSHLPDSSVWRP